MPELRLDLSDDAYELLLGLANEELRDTSSEAIVLIEQGLGLRPMPIGQRFVFREHGRRIDPENPEQKKSVAAIDERPLEGSSTHDRERLDS